MATNSPAAWQSLRYGLRRRIRRWDTSRTGSIVSGGTQAKFPKSAHLLKHADFQRVYQNGKRHFSVNLTAFYLQRAGNGEAAVRVGFTVGKVLGGAVDRNRIRRRTREAVRYHLRDLNGISDSVDVIIHPKKSVLKIEFSVLSEEVAKVFQVVRKNVACQGKASGE